MAEIEAFIAAGAPPIPAQHSEGRLMSRSQTAPPFYSSAATPLMKLLPVAPGYMRRKDRRKRHALQAKKAIQGLENQISIAI